MVLPNTSPCADPPAGWWAAQDPPRNAVTVSKSRWVKASIVISTYSAIAGSWPKTLHRVIPRGRDGRSIMSTPAVAACSTLSRGASGKSGRQMWPTTISASANAGIRRCVSVRSARAVGSTSSVILARMRGATRAASPPRNNVFMIGANPQVVATTLISGAPRTQRPILSAISSQRRRTMPCVQPELCGVTMTLGNS